MHPSHGHFELIQNASAFASRAHRHQLRKDGRTPYVSHVFRVAMTVRHVFECADAATIAAALLHDTIEDTTTDYDDLLERFGADVADTVAALTKNMAMPEAARETAYDAQIAASNWRARLIKLADAYDNLCDAPTSGEAIHKHEDRARRALRLAEADRGRAEIDRAAAALTALLARA